MNGRTSRKRHAKKKELFERDEIEEILYNHFAFAKDNSPEMLDAIDSAKQAIERYVLRQSIEELEKMRAKQGSLCSIDGVRHLADRVAELKEKLGE